MMVFEVEHALLDLIHHGLLMWAENQLDCGPGRFLLRAVTISARML
jgi:hypothetical protein